jgi:putative intracellular protease/amidase
MANILMVVSAADSLTMKDGSQHPTGFWAEELVVAHRTLQQAGHNVDFATPGGVKPTVDKISLQPDMVGSEERAEDFRTYLEMIDVDLFAPLVLADVDMSGYDAVVLPGGHGPMADLFQDKDLGRILVEADGASKIIAPFCHGPAGLLSATALVRGDGAAREGRQRGNRPGLGQSHGAGGQPDQRPEPAVQRGRGQGGHQGPRRVGRTPVDQRPGSATHAGLDPHEVDLVAGVAPAFLVTREPLRVQMVLCAELGQRLVVRLVEPLAGNLLHRAVGKGDGDEDALREMPVHPDEAFGILLQIDQSGPPSWLWLPVSRTFQTKKYDGGRRQICRPPAVVLSKQ